MKKAAWKGGTLQTALFEPFEILRHSNQESSRKEKEKAGSGRELGIWLPSEQGGVPALERVFTAYIYKEEQTVITRPVLASFEGFPVQKARL